MIPNHFFTHPGRLARFGAALIGIAVLGSPFLAAGGFAPAGQVAALAHDSQAGGMRYDSFPPNTGPAEQYVLIGAKWDHEPVTYDTENCPRSLNCAVAWDTVGQAMGLWSANCGIQLVEVASNGDIRVGWYTQISDGPGGVLGEAYPPLPQLGSLAGDIELDDAEAWVVTPPTTPYQVDLKTVLLHEIGHAIGLDHSHDPSAIMYSEYAGVRTLGPDDIAGCQALYGPPTGASQASPTPPPSGPAPSGVTAVAAMTVNIRSGPGANYDAIASLPAATTVPVLGRNETGQWLYIDYSGLRGWVAAWLFTTNGDLSTIPVVDVNGNGALPAPGPGPTPAGPAPAPTQPSAPSSPTGVTGVASTTVRIRSGPGTNYGSIGSVPANGVVSVLGKNATGSWLFIDFAGTQGWVATWVFAITGDLNTVPIVPSSDTLGSEVGPSAWGILAAAWLPVS